MTYKLLKSHSCAVLTTAEVIELEKRTVKAGISFTTLMEKAGAAVYQTIVENFQPTATTILCGPGNNGGDGYVVAKLFKANGWSVKVATKSSTAAMSRHATLHRSQWDGEIIDLDLAALEGCGLVVDGLFGTGLARDLTGDYQTMVSQSQIPCVSIDIPSGINSDTGQIMGGAIKAQITVTFGYRKPGHLLLPGRVHTGQLVVADIGFIEPDLEEITTFVNRPELWQPYVQESSLEDHKYKRGHVLIRGGIEMTGAARLASHAARRIGAGMVTISCAPEVRQIYALSTPGVLTVEETDFGDLLVNKPKSAVLLGPGNGVNQATKQAVVTTLSSRTPCVLDADALTVFEDNPDELFDLIVGPCILTPHEGEFSRLFNHQGDKISRSQAAAQQSGAVVLLKGADTVIVASEGSPIMIQDNAPPYLATAGTGDVLAGILVGLLGQGFDPFIAACIGSWLHGEAANRIGFGLIAEDLPDIIPTIYSSLQ